MNDPLVALDLAAEPDAVALAELAETMIVAEEPAWKMDAVTYRELSDSRTRELRSFRPEAQTRTIPGPAGELSLRLLMPPTVRSVYFHIHGGAWLMGANDLADEILWARAVAADTAVVSLNYRLGPEHRWPAPADDCLAAARWLAEHAAAEFGTDRIVISGESAGAHLSAVTLVRLRDRDGAMPICGADLRYGMYDLRLSPSARLNPSVILDPPTMEWMLDQTFDADRDDPDVSPLLADLRGLPPALFTCGTADCLLDDTLFMWARWRAAGNPAELSLHPGSVHAFDFAPITAAGRALEQSVAFISRVTA